MYIHAAVAVDYITAAVRKALHSRPLPCEVEVGGPCKVTQANVERTELELYALVEQVTHI